VEFRYPARPGRVVAAVRVRSAAGRGRPGRAELVATFQANRDRYGAAHPDTVGAGVRLAKLHRAAGDRAAARRVLTVVYVEARAALGERHPVIAAVERELAAIEPPMPSAPVDLPTDRHSPALQRRHAPRRLGWRLLLVAALAVGLGLAVAVVLAFSLAPTGPDVPTVPAQVPGAPAPATATVGPGSG
jgi:hypothetical protein